MKSPFHISGLVLSMGEILLRMIPDEEGAWLRTQQIPFSLGGAELNVATDLAHWEIPSRYFTAMPDNTLSWQILGFLKEKKMDISSVHLGSGRLGIFYLTQGTDMKNDSLIYDRARSTFSQLRTGMIDWETVLQGVSWLNFSAISPGISQDAADLCEEALIEASKLNISISMDLNYRAKLWQYGKNPDQIVPKLLPYCDLIMGNIWSIEKMAGLKSCPKIPHSGERKDYETLGLLYSEMVTEQYPNCQVVANTFRFEEEKKIQYYASLYENKEIHHSREYQTDSFIDKVGSGDCFMAGLIYGYYQEWDPQRILDYATAAAFDKLFIKGDATTSHPQEIQKRIEWK